MTAIIESVQNMQNFTDSTYQNTTEIPNYRIFNQDCAQGLQSLPDNSIDCIITDPPYFIDGMGNEWNDTNLKTKASKSGVIGGLPVGMKFDKAQGERLQEFMTPLAKEFYRILKAGGFCIVFSQARLYHRMAMSLDLAGFEIRDMLAWKYEGQAKAFSQTHFIKKDKKLTQTQKEALIRELEGFKTPQLKPQIEPMVMAQKVKEGTFVQNWQKYKLGLINTKESLDGKFPSNVMEVSKHTRKSESNMKIEHLTPKPVRLISHLIRLFTQEGQVILDPFMGSGSHIIAALQTKRRCIGYEIEKKYFEIAKQRIEKEVL
ncbi:site-specific DNA-methyltransferase [Campylobacter sp. MIT 21-1685]|uniref:DNA-methyltransferase n=1 Tax=unclassified Campylobacter TaxID=2593542 RepID=UPI00224AC7CD|nr:MULTISPECIES: site-specific DNA-methyltransferase [unclassified Campylobacter]MCX2682958.1 site-specific DNA-methyltransferase [Campylobacter sp. MIT 21-1684]MCX2751240.1 site-specific DNA-methyltransferase [Campylobacter sp. MIT 21-1682]MCX2807439.1 site-specific DNA-methyltransferase [Campylobacter sp. MIT 21-1685]